MTYPQNSADQLYALLPAIYRIRDLDADAAKNEHLKAYLGATGALLDLARHTLEQLYDDGFPDESAGDRLCQDWVLPYLAELVAARLRSPYPGGQRAEVANAVRWAQRKGTLTTIEEIAEAILQSETEVQEGFQRVATTARLDRPLPSAQSLGQPGPMAPDPTAEPGWTMQEAARHPGLRTATVDFRQISRAVVAQAGAPAVQRTVFGGTPVWPQDDTDPAITLDAAAPVFWRQFNPHGAPCFLGSYEDVSARSVDLRSPAPDRRWGLYHPRRVILHVSPPYGICAPDPVGFPWDPELASLQSGVPPGSAAKLSDYVTKTVLNDGTVVYRNATAHSVRLTGTVEISAPTRFEKLRIQGELRLRAGRLALSRCAVGSLTSTAPAEADGAPPTIRLRDTLLGKLTATANTVEMEYVTVLGTTSASQLLASEAILVGAVAGIGARDCLRYSRVPKEFYDLLSPIMRKNGLTTAAPRFFSAVYDEPGCGVLRQDAPAAIREGAEDGGEMGAHHAWRHAAGLTALIDKLADFMPIGIDPVAVWDDRLLCPPPALSGA